ncbi:unnamed protein product [Rotaria sordida]|uniref:Voltage-dependent T-type calcium channel subunit alpha n=1 Tax=Rotaria sordida TaxID=392033 RepID=A0A813PSK6_9BILA|nr:unnamed protein product [Rotaria sordida]CAF0957396.1 unnamed protein product [Rotaria sordida]
MDKTHLTTTNNINHTINNTNNLYCSSSSTIVPLPNDDRHIHETDRFLNEHASSNIISDLPRSRNLEETDENDLPFPGFVDRVFYCLRQTSPLRYQCLQLITWPWFERISMFVILLNCVTLGMYQPCAHQSGVPVAKKCDTVRCLWLQATDYFIFGFFTIEMCIKMTAMGIFGKGTYLAETWNRLDCFIVIAGLIESLIPGDNLSLSAIRTIRVLRPLRAINRVPSMRILVMLLLDTLPMLGNVLLLCFFVFFIFGIVGVQLWKGLLRNRCFLQLNITSIPDHPLFNDLPLRPFYIPSDHNSFVCSNPQSSGMTKCSEIPTLRKGNMTCELDFYTSYAEIIIDLKKTVNGCINWNQYYQFCNVSDKNPFSGSISFDNIGLAWVVIFQIISLESWVTIMYYIQDAHSFWDWIYFVFLIIIGSFFMINLCLVVIATQFSETKKRETERMLAERRRFSRSSSTLVSDEPGSCWEEAIKYIERLWHHGHRRLIVLWKHYKKKRTKLNEKRLSEVKKHRRKTSTTINNKNSSSIQIQIHSTANSSPLSNLNIIHRPNCPLYQPTHPSTPPSINPYLINAPAASPEVSDIIDSTNAPTPTNEPKIILHSPFVNSSTTSTLSPILSRNRRKKSTDIVELICPDINIISSANNMVENLLDETINKKPNTQFCECQQQDNLNGENNNNDNDNDNDDDNNNDDDDDDNDINQEKKEKKRSKINILFHQYCLTYLTKIRQTISRFVVSKYFRRIVLSAIVVNTLSMGIEYHGQPPSLTNALEYSNLVFTSLFAIEMILKIIAEGCLKYIKNSYNIFDGVIVIMSVIELQGNQNSGLSVLRTFRLLRVLKLVRFMPTLRRQLVVMLKTMDNVATFFSLLILFIFIFSILGMNLFGCKFCKYIEVEPNKRLEFECARENFDSLLWATLTVFQVLTQEDWNEVLYNGMEKTSAWAALYFIALMTFGNYVLFNLLVAILVEGFSTEKGGNMSESGGSSDRLAKADPFKTQALFTGDVEVPANPHELITDDITSVKNSTTENKNLRAKEVKIMSIPKIAISNEFDSSLKIFETHPQQINTTPTPPTPYKSIIKNRSSQPQTPSSTSTTQSYYTCPTRFDSNFSNDPMRKSFIKNKTSDPNSIKKQTIDENDTEYDISGFSNLEDISKMQTSRNEQQIPRRRGTISTASVLHSNNNLNENVPKKQYSLRKNHSFTYVTNENISTSTFNKSSRNSFIPHITEPPPPLPYAEKNARNSLTQISHGQRQKKSLPVRRTNSYRPSSSSSTTVLRRFILRDGKLIEQDINNSQPIIKRRSTFDNSLYPMTQIETSNTYETVQLEDNEQHIKTNSNNSIRLVIDNNLNTQSIVNDQSDMQLDIERKTKKPQLGIFRACLIRLCGERCFRYLKKRDHYSLYLFSPENRLRRALKYLIAQKTFDYSILFFISLNCITLAMERPSIPPISFEREFLNMTNYIFTAIFTIEMVIKIIAGGLICGSHTYLHTGWNVMDGFLVIISVIDLATMSRGGSAITPINADSDATTRIFSMLRVFRLLRTLRPLRVISRAPGLKLVVQTLLSSLRPIGHIVVICCTFFIIFGILGVQLFKGKFYYCAGEFARNVTTKRQCVEMPDHQWKNQQFNFDNLGQALLALFVLASRDGWIQIMYNGIDAVDVDMQPIRNYNEPKLIYFISFLLLVGFFVLNMFVGVVVENFHKCRAEQEREEKARRTAKRARKIERKRRRMHEIPYYAHFSPWRRRLHDICNSKYFDLIIAAVIGLNVVTMSLEFYLMPPIFDLALDYCNYVFTGVFIIESISKIIALGPLRYFKDKWNQIDTTIVVLSIAGIVMEKMKSGQVLPINPTLIRVMRVLRIARVLKLLKMATGIRALLDTVIQALPQVGNLGLLFFLLFFIFAALGVELFGKLECDDDHPCTGLNKHAHFKDFGMAFLTLFRIATGDNWNGIMKDALRNDDSPHSVKNPFMTALAPIYFVVFVLMAQFVLVNVVVAVLMKKLDESNRMVADEAEIDEEIERQLEADAHDRNYLEQPLLDDKDLDLLNDNTMQLFPLTKQLSLPPNFTFHSMSSPTPRRPKFKTIEVVKGSSLSSVIGSPSRFITLQIDKSSSSVNDEENIPLNVRTSTEVLYRPTSIISHHRSNTVPSRDRRSDSRIKSNQQTTYLSPTYKRHENIQRSPAPQPFSPSLLPSQARRRIRAIDDPDEIDSPTGSITNRYV